MVLFTVLSVLGCPPVFTGYFTLACSSRVPGLSLVIRLCELQVWLQQGWIKDQWNRVVEGQTPPIKT